MAGPVSKRERTVSDIMAHPVVTATASETVAEACARMHQHKVGSVIVVDGDRPIGILTERDLVRFAASGIDGNSAKVGEWMTPEPDTIAPDEEVTQSFRHLLEKNYRHFPVVSGGKLAGIVSARDLMRISQIRPITPAGFEAPKGLEGVVVGETEIGDVRGMEGFYHYRQYNAVELAEKRTLEDVWHLLYRGRLPNKAELEAFRAEIVPLRVIPDDVKKLLPDIAAIGRPDALLDGLRSAYSLLASSLGFRSWLDLDIDTVREQGMRTCAVIPTLLTALHRLHTGEQPVDPDPELGFAANYLYMLSGERPPPENARAIEQYLISTVDHGFNSSSFTARVIASTGADLGSAVVGAIGALSGPLHGGAPSRALDMLDAIGKPENADAWIRDAVTHGKRLMGFGHRIYKTDDPRSVMLRGVAERLGGPMLDFAKHVEERCVSILAELKPGRNLYTNVEYYAGVVMDRVGVPREMFTPTFVSSRSIGWTSHVIEQASDNRLIRPNARYAGPPPPDPVPDLQ